MSDIDEFIREQESRIAANYEACFNAAGRQGYSVEQAGKCAVGGLGCLECPFRENKEFLKHG